MRKFARVVDGVVFEIIVEPDGYDINDMFAEWFVATLVDVTNVSPEVVQHMTATQVAGGGWQFTPYTPSDAEILAANSSLLRSYTQLASAQKAALTNRISTIQDAIDGEYALPEEIAEQPVRQTQLAEWKKYAVLLGRVTAQSGWYLSVDWPVQPSAGIDLTVSAVSQAKPAVS